MCPFIPCSSVSDVTSVQSYLLYTALRDVISPAKLGLRRPLWKLNQRNCCSNLGQRQPFPPSIIRNAECYLVKVLKSSNDSKNFLICGPRSSATWKGVLIIIYLQPARDSCHISSVVFTMRTPSCMLWRFIMIQKMRCHWSQRIVAMSTTKNSWYLRHHGKPLNPIGRLSVHALSVPQLALVGLLMPNVSISVNARKHPPALAKIPRLEKEYRTRWWKLVIAASLSSAMTKSVGFLRRSRIIRHSLICANAIFDCIKFRKAIFIVLLAEIQTQG